MVAVSVFIIIGYSLEQFMNDKNKTGRGKRSISAVTFQFYPWFKFSFLLFKIDYHTRTRTPPSFPRSRSHIFARLLPKRHPYYLRAWKRLKHDQRDHTKRQTSEIQGIYQKNSFDCLSVNWLTLRQDKHKLHVLDSPSPPLQSLLNTFLPVLTGGRACVRTLTS